MTPAPSSIRILYPQRLDMLSRAMCSGMFTMWMQMQHAADLVFWGPGFTGYRPEPLDEAARRLDCDAVLLPDLHHAIPGLWDTLWEGAERCDVPVIMFLSDPGSAIGPRTEAIRRTRPDLLLALGAVEFYREYDAVRAEVGARIMQRPLGFDPDLFDERGAADDVRDIDVLVVGAADAEAYILRRRIQTACRELADRRRVMDLTHPGYWEISRKGLFSASRVDRHVIAAWLRLFFSGGISVRESLTRLRVHRAKESQRERLKKYLLPAPVQHGQAAFAELLRRTKLVVTGTTFDIIAEKYYETAGCGAIGIGDAPAQPGADEVRPAMLVVSPDDDEDAIRRQVEALLDDPADQARRRAAARTLAGRTDHLARAHEVVAGLVEAVGYTHREHAPLPFTQVSFEREYVGAVIQTDPSAPRPRRTWADLRDQETAGTELRRLLGESVQPLAALALSSESALPPDVHLLAERARQDAPALACRPTSAVEAQATGGAGELNAAGWSLLVVDRPAFLATLEGRDARTAADVAAAVLEHADDHGAVLHEGPGFDEAGAADLRAAATSQRDASSVAHG